MEVSEFIRRWQDGRKGGPLKVGNVSICTMLFPNMDLVTPLLPVGFAGAVTTLGRTGGGCCAGGAADVLGVTTDGFRTLLLLAAAAGCWAFASELFPYTEAFSRSTLRWRLCLTLSRGVSVL